LRRVVGNQQLPSGRRRERNPDPDSSETLAKNFPTPPDSARPWVYWFHLSGTQTKEGITADLEAMKRVGIGGATYFEVNEGVESVRSGPAEFAGRLWRELFQHACNEARRLGLEIDMNNDAGWTGGGGPWITPDLSMQRIVWSGISNVLKHGR
jgi:hypothetical protein